MKKLASAAFTKLIILVLLVGFVVVFFYFEPSISLRILLICFGLLSFWQLTKAPQIMMLLLLYLGVLDFYNLHYGFSIPLAILMIFVFILADFLFIAETRLANLGHVLEKKVFGVFSWTISLSILEFFVVMNFWPVSPQTKALIMAIVFFLFGRIFYLYSNNMLSFRRAMGYVISSVVIFGIIIFLNLQFGL